MDASYNQQQRLKPASACMQSGQSYKCSNTLQSNFSGSNTFGTMKISSRQGLFEPLRVYYRARSGGIIGVSLRFSSS